MRPDERNKPMSQLLQIAHLGQSMLWEKAQPIENVHDPCVQHLIDDMIQTTRYVNAVGLAANQVHHSKRLIVIAPRITALTQLEKNTEFLAAINPMVRRASKVKVKDWEACLSIPGLFGLVSRHEWITFSYTDRFGDMHEETLHGFPARVLQHEIDHLDGITYLERVKSRQLVMEREYRKLLAQKQA